MINNYPCIYVREKYVVFRGFSEDTGKTEVPCHSRCGTIKIYPCSKALRAEHRPTFCSPSPVIVKSPYNTLSFKRKIMFTYIRSPFCHMTLTFGHTCDKFEYRNLYKNYQKYVIVLKSCTM
jgi:hypothetical protein